LQEGEVIMRAGGPVAVAAALLFATSGDASTRRHDYDVRHYLIRIAFDWTGRRVLGDVTVTLRPLVEGLSSVDLDGIDMTIQSVARGSGQELQYAYDGRRITIAMDGPRPIGRDVAVRITYEAAPRHGLKFLSRRDGEEPDQIWTIGQTATNRYWVP